MKNALAITEEALIKGRKMIETNNDLSPNARIAMALKFSLSNPDEVSMSETKGDLELF